ncbi:MAG: DUF1559 domain-containing protein [Armatimonadetes bacterium]|nr:DUF1559 domain-containing protein [Armatimonadota bacterium]
MALRKPGSHAAATIGVVLGAFWTVLIAVSAILLPAILFPVFARARDKARQASCQSNLMQMGLAMRMYVEDYDGRLPEPAAQWPGQLNPYLKNWQILLCPSDGRDQKQVFADAGGASHELSYGLNPEIEGKTLAELTDPAGLAALFDARRLLDDPLSADPRHAGGADFCFVDGHVSWRRIEGSSP